MNQYKEEMVRKINGYPLLTGAEGNHLMMLVN
jgi:hypothetical protein